MTVILHHQVYSSIFQLTNGAQRLREECSPANQRHKDSSQLQTQFIIQCAYDIAMAAKKLVVLFD